MRRFQLLHETIPVADPKNVTLMPYAVGLSGMAPSAEAHHRLVKKLNNIGLLSPERRHSAEAIRTAIDALRQRSRAFFSDMLT